MHSHVFVISFLRLYILTLHTHTHTLYVYVAPPCSLGPSYSFVPHSEPLMQAKPSYYEISSLQERQDKI